MFAGRYVSKLNLNIVTKQLKNYITLKIQWYIMYALWYCVAVYACGVKQRRKHQKLEVLSLKQVKEQTLYRLLLSYQ